MKIFFKLEISDIRKQIMIEKRGNRETKLSKPKIIQNEILIRTER
jgi:hypothetical protein